MDYISDPGVRTNSGAPLLTPWTPRGMSNDAFKAQSAQDAHKAAVDTAVSKAEQTPTLSAGDSDKSFITGQIQGLMKRLQILQKLFSGNPKGMAQALTQIFKELRGLLKQYKDATGSEFSGADVAAASVTTAPANDNADAAPTTASTTDASTTDTTQAADPATTATAPASTDDTADAMPSASTPAVAAASYAEVDQALREAIGTDGLKFLDTLRGLISAIDQKMMTPARIQHAAHKSDKDEDQAFKDMDEQLKALNKDMSDMKDGISQDAPTLGTQVSVTA